MTSLVSRRKHGFASGPLHNKREPHPVYFLSQRSSFWIATLSVMAFIIGNMIGQHGWYLFMASVLGNQDDSLIVYMGTVSPIEKVPDYSKWSAYGGSAELHTFRQVPQNLLIDLPQYDQYEQLRTRSASTTSSFYSVGNRGSYSTGAENSGSHPGVDIRVPIGTPVRAVANGIVEEIKTGGGYGNVVIVRHPNVPDPDRPNSLTTLYSCYAHLQSFLVSEGDVVQKGQQIAYSGDSGFVTGPHLHFQMDRESAPFHPFWPFTDEEATKAHLTTDQAVDVGLYSERLTEYTVHPMLYVQSNYPSFTQQVVVQDVQAPPVLTREERVALRIHQRLAEHVAEVPASSVVVQTVAANTQDTTVHTAPPLNVLKPAPPAAPVVRLSLAQRIAQSRQERIQERLEREKFATLQVARTPTIVQTSEVASRDTESILMEQVIVANVEVQHDESYSGRGWEKITVQLTDAQGNLIFNPRLDRDIYMHTAYGDAEFRPAILSQVDFVQGEAEVYMLPRGRRTIVIQAQPFQNVSRPMEYVKD
ncbi:hypothetical protein COU76_01205 [Candidatus Peregrinibacteria bacterium CG10_big_fil_rev_8_21_14_0_10_49_10]|nr:MAG: hypothetical protein COU76_01205 [Candidatus Peregrinibacteria bacterium CG10_big_fil_rev_8_21_14_0_10_49_10]